MKHKKAYPTKYYIRFITFIAFTLLGIIYRIKKVLPSEVRKLKTPYLLLCNHIGLLDPFIIGNFLPRFTHFVASDASMRHRVNRFFMTRLGVIPIKKNVTDTKVIRDIITVIKQGGNVGIFPEAGRNWDGTTMNMDSSTVRMVKMLKVPVVVAVLKGMNLFNPRWAKKVRRTKLEVEYKLLFTPEQLKELSDNELDRRLNQALYHDEVDYQRKHMNKIHSDIRAEYINHTLYVCPECNAIDSFTVDKNDFSCSNCNYDIHIDEYGFFSRVSDGKLHFDNIRDWYNWEGKWLTNFISDLFEDGNEDIIFEDKNSKIFYTTTMDNPDFVGNADVKLYMNRIEIDFKDRDECIVMNFDDLQTISAQIDERLEIYYNNQAYRIIGYREGVSALKWEVALNAIWKKLGQTSKLVHYISF